MKSFWILFFRVLFFREMRKLWKYRKCAGGKTQLLPDNDINSELINLYENIRDNCESLIQLLEHFQTEYLETPEADRKNLYLGKRETYNHFIVEQNPEQIKNQTCFLHRKNSLFTFEENLRRKIRRALLSDCWMPV